MTTLDSQAVRPPCVAVHDSYGIWPLVGHLLESCLPHPLAPELRGRRVVPGKATPLPPSLSLSFAVVKPTQGTAGSIAEIELVGTEDDNEGVAVPMLHFYMVHCEAETDHKTLARKISDWARPPGSPMGRVPSPPSPPFLVVLVSCNATATSRMGSN
eukprot:RCo020522